MPTPKRPRQSLLSDPLVWVVVLAILAVVALQIAQPFVPPPQSSTPSLRAQAEAAASPAVRSSPAPATPSPPPIPAAVPEVSDVYTPASARSRGPFVELGALDSLPGESRDAYLVRLAQAMDLFTRQTLHEVCGVIMESDAGDAWRTRLTTNRSHVACGMVGFKEPGYHRWGPDIHTHPRVTGGVEVNAQDALRTKKYKCGDRVYVIDETFSQQDMGRGPGFLVSRGRLLYQRGAQFPIQQRAVFQAIDQMPDLVLSSPDSPLPGSPAGAAAVDLEQAAQAAWSNQAPDNAPAQAFPLTRCDSAPETADPPDAQA